MAVPRAELQGKVVESSFQDQSCTFMAQKWVSEDGSIVLFTLRLAGSFIRLQEGYEKDMREGFCAFLSLFFFLVLFFCFVLEGKGTF